MSLSYIICTNPRTGSWLLCHGLKATAVAGRPWEWFNISAEPRLRKKWGVKVEIGPGFPAYLDRVLQQERSRNGVFGAKIHYFEFEKLPHRLAGIERYKDHDAGEILTMLLPGAKFLWLKRLDRERQAISYWKGLLTKKWWKTDDAPSPPSNLVFDPSSTHHLEQTLTECDRGWEIFFRSHAIMPLTIWYEDLAANYAGTLQHVIDYLGIPAASNLTFGPPRLRKQADAETETWLQQYREYKARFLSPPT